MDLTITDSQIFTVLNIEKREAQKFTILAPYYDDKETSQLHEDLEKENKVHIYRVKKLENTRHSIYMVTMHFSYTKKITGISLNGKIKEVRNITNLKKCRKCNATTHTTIACWKEEQACFKCGGDGHRIKDCKNKPICSDCRGPHRAGDNSCKHVKEKMQKLQKHKKTTGSKRVQANGKHHKRKKIHRKTNKLRKKYATKKHGKQPRKRRGSGIQEQNRT